MGTSRITELAALLAELPVDERAQLAILLAGGQAAKTPAKAAGPKTAPKPVSLERAEKLVAAGADPWKIQVTSSSGNVVPFGVVRRALRVQKFTAERQAAKGKTAKTKAAKGSNRRAANPYFRMSKAELVADGGAGALAEMARRAARNAAK